MPDLSIVVDESNPDKPHLIYKRGDGVICEAFLRVQSGKVVVTFPPKHAGRRFASLKEAVSFFDEGTLLSSMAEDLVDVEFYDTTGRCALRTRVKREKTENMDAFMASVADVLSLTSSKALTATEKDFIINILMKRMTRWTTDTSRMPDVLLVRAQ